MHLLTEALAAPLSGTGVVVVDLLPGLVRTPMTAGMPVWRDVPDHEWAPAELTAEVIVEVALGRYDDRASLTGLTEDATEDTTDDTTEDTTGEGSE